MSKDTKPMDCAKSGRFCWNELVTTSVPGAKKFYGGLLGWKTKPFGKGSPGYTLLLNGKDSVGGMMKCPKPGNPAQWIPYVIVEDVDATAKKAGKLGGGVLVPPFEVKGVGRIAVLEDAQEAAFGIIRPEM